MERQDRGLAFMLQYENIAWYEKGAVRILDPPGLSAPCGICDMPAA